MLQQSRKRATSDEMLSEWNCTRFARNFEAVVVTWALNTELDEQSFEGRACAHSIRSIRCRAFPTRAALRDYGNCVPICTDDDAQTSQTLTLPRVEAMRCEAPPLDTHHARSHSEKADSETQNSPPSSSYTSAGKWSRHRTISSSGHEP